MTAIDAVGIVLDALNRLGAHYMAGGRLADNFYAMARMSHEVVFDLDTDRAPFTAVTAALGTEFRPFPIGAKLGAVCHCVDHTPTGLRVVFLKLSPDDYPQRRFARRQQAMLAGRAIFVPTVEDVVISGLRWPRAVGEGEVEYVRHVLALHLAHLDLAYIRHWADLHGTRELFEKLWAAASA